MQVSPYGRELMMSLLMKDLLVDDCGGVDVRNYGQDVDIGILLVPPS